ncbi:MAG: aldolase/citrate lyase family protein [Zestosphaera sp.]
MRQYVMWREKMSKLSSGRPLLGAWITISHPEIVDILSNMSFDWFMFDMEHAPLTVRDVETLLMPLKGTDIIPFVRVAWNDPVLIKLALDLGVAGVLVPWVNSKEEAERAVRAVRYPPAGIRGVGPRRCVSYGIQNVTEYFQRWNELATLIVQIETKIAYENLDEILSTEGVSGVFVGPSDLSASLGYFGRVDSQEFTRVLEDIVERARRHAGKIVGIMATTPDFAKRVVDMGYNFISLSHDTRYLIRGAELYLKAVQQH